MPPGRAFHGLIAYREHAEAFVWGLQQLGHEATYSMNGTRPDAINLVMGVQMLAIEQLAALPPRTVIYNLEQMARRDLATAKPVIREVARRFPIWDFSEFNLDAWRTLGVADPQYVKIGWAPVLERIARPAQQDIEVLIYGLPGAERLALFQSLCEAGLKSVFVCGLYGAERDALIARSKIVVNASYYTQSRIFEISRVSYLLGNAKAVVSLEHPDTLIEADMREAVFFAPQERIVQACLALAEDDARRAGLEERGRRAMRARDMREILRPALAKLPAA